MEAGLLLQIPAEMRNGDAMTAIHFLAAAAILMVGLACAILPFVAVWDRRLAVARRRSLYDKSAGQVESLTAILGALFAVALGADLLMKGAVDSLMTGTWRIFWEGMVMISAFAALCSIIVLYANRGLRNAFSVLSGLAFAASSSLCILLVWAFLFGAVHAPAAGAEQAAHDLIVVLASVKSADFILFVLFSVLFAASGAYGLALCWHILLRKRDDFGRDYYSFVLGMRSRQAAYAGLFLSMIAAVQYSLYPQMDKDWALSRLPFAGEYAEAVLTGGLLCLPVAFALWYSMARSSVPMQKRSYAFLSLFLLVAGAYCLLVRI